jgi:hypothetical protein
MAAIHMTVSPASLQVSVPVQMAIPGQIMTQIMSNIMMQVGSATTVIELQETNPDQ